MTRKSQLPQDLKNYARSAFLRKSKPFFISFALTALALIFFGDVILPTKYPEAKAIIYTLVLALPFIFTKFPFCVMDSTYCGIIEKVEVKTAKDIKMSKDGDASARTTYNALHLCDVSTVYIYIRTHRGELIKRNAYSGMASNKAFIDTYQKDDEIFHLYGTDTIVILPKRKDTYVKCPVCGVMNEKERGACRECGHTIISSLVFAGEYETPSIVEELRKAPVKADNVPADTISAHTAMKAVKKESAAENENAETTDKYAQARKNAILARKMREEHAAKLQKEEVDFYADYDAKIIKKAKEDDDKKDRRSFFWEFFSYFGTAVLITHAVSYIAMAFLGRIFLTAEINFFVQTLIFCSILFSRFFVFGKNEFPNNRVDMKTIFKASALSWLIYAVVYAIYHGSAVLIPDPFYGGRVPGDGIDALALVFCGLPNRYVTAQSLLYDIVHGWVKPVPMPEIYLIALPASFLINAAFYTWFVWFAYKWGVNENDMERRDVREGTDVMEKIYEKRRFAKCFVPFVNYYPIYSWSYDYWVNPEPDRKLKYFFRAVLVMLGGMTAIELLRYLFYVLCKSVFLNGVVFYLSLHLVGCVISLVAYFDDKRHEKLMERYKD